MAKPDPKKKDKKSKEFEHDSSKYIDIEPSLDEAVNGTAVIAWGRMNPMTAGHEKLVNKVLQVAKSEKGTPHIFLTHTADKKKNPLSYDDKIKYAQAAFGSVVKKSTAKTIFQLMGELNKSYNKVVLIAGSDRVKEFETLLAKYNGKEYNFDEIKVVSAGQRDEESDDTSGISGTKMRNYATSDMKKFAANLPKRLKSKADEIATKVRKGMGMSEDQDIEETTDEMNEVLSKAARLAKGRAMKRAAPKIARARALAAKKTASPEKIKGRAKQQAIKKIKAKFAKGKSYAKMSPQEKEMVDKKVAKVSKSKIDQIARKLIPKVKADEKARKLSANKKEEVEINVNEASYKDSAPRKRFHMLMDKNNKMKFDSRFKLYKKKPEPLEEDFAALDAEIAELIEMTESFMLEGIAPKDSKPDEAEPLAVAANKAAKEKEDTGEEEEEAPAEDEAEDKPAKKKPVKPVKDADDGDEMDEANVDEMSINKKSFTKSGNEKLMKALNTQKLKADLKAMRDRLKKK
jgi:nicotinic acid mononucleotide adenylyltransferase